MRPFQMGVAAIAALLAGTFAGQADEAGRAEYLDSCASCHGADGTGAGYLAGFLTVEIPDLTTIKARNDGVFPMLDIIHIVDGRTGVRGHGEDMPVWGNRFKFDMAKDSGDYGAETMIRGKILSLVYYLDSIQN